MTADTSRQLDRRQQPLLQLYMNSFPRSLFKKSKLVRYKQGTVNPICDICSIFSAHLLHSEASER